ncbi:apolipoprotein M-like [Oncorhynchus masou masou]|uniref:apolipoprotein M-like n=1 Tax=Oncorhynchus masou masou TaxID=90313 RepID=UPI00318464D4
MLEAKEVYSFLLFVNGWLCQLFSPCSQPVLLSTSSLNTQQYLGKWYFIAAAGVKESDVQMFRQMDSTVFYLDETSKNALLLTGAMRVGVHCIMKNWTYTIQSGKDDLTSEGRPELQTLVWSGEWLNCTQCILLQEIERHLDPLETHDTLNRFMLYARDSALLDNKVVTAFQTQTACKNMDRFVHLPQEKELCKLENKV